MNQLTIELARKILGEAYDIGEDQPLIRCRINYFEAAYLALPPGGLALVRQNMMGRQSHEWIPVSDISAVSEVKKRGKPALRFEAGGLVWQVDRVLADRWQEVKEHLEQTDPKPVAPARPDTQVTAEGAPVPDTPQRAPRPPRMATPPPPVTTDSASAVAPVTRTADPLVSGPLPEALPPPKQSQDPVADLLAQLVDTEEPTAVLHQIFGMCMNTGQADRALLAAQALVSMDEAGPAERQHVDRFHTNRLLSPEQPLSEETWDQLLPVERPDAALMAVAQALAPALIRMTARPAKDYGLGERPPDADHLSFGRVFREVQAAMGMPDMDYHPLLDQKGGLQFANLSVGRRWAPTLVVGTDLLAGHSDLELAFLIARELTYLRMPHLLRVLAPSLPQQAVLVLTAVAMSDPTQPIAGEHEEAIKTQLRHLSAHMELDDFERVGEAVRSMLSVAEPFDLARWNGSVDRAALRAGLVICGDLTVACRMVSRVLADAEVDTTAVRASLVRFALSDIHLQIRRDLGLAIADS